LHPRRQGIDAERKRSLDVPAEPRQRVRKFRLDRTQHAGVVWRLKSVETDPRSLTAVLTRTAAMLLIAALLILVLLPAVLAASSR